MKTLDDAIHVLHVDDEPDFADMAASFLEQEDDRITVTTAMNASDGLDLLADRNFDCIVSDYDMPGQDGIEFLETIREEYSDLPFILYTGNGSEDIASDAIAAGATDYLQKGSGTDQYELLANRIVNAVAQDRASKRAAELDRIRTLVNNINQALVRAESRTEAETRICEIISDSDPYLFAWIGEVDPDTTEIQPRAWAGIEEGYLEEITVTADDTPTGQGPGGRAIRERRVAVSQNVQEDAELERWREAALERGYQAIAAIPLEYDDTLYGALGVYADRPYAFDETERNLLAELGNDIAHAFHSFDLRVNLREQHDFITQALDTLNDLFYVVGPDGELRRWNDQLPEVTGYTDEEIERMQAFEFFPADERERIGDAIEEALATGETVVEADLLTADGERIPYEFLGDRLTDTNGDLLGLIGIGRDITERKEYERRLETLIDNLPGMVYRCKNEPGWPMEHIGGEVEELIGYPPSEMERRDGIYGTQIIHPDDREDVWNSVQDALDAGESFELTYRIRTKSGAIKWVWERGRGIYSDADVEAIEGFITDITDRKERAHKLRQYETLVEAVGDPIYILDEEGHFEMANEAMLEQFEVDRETVVGTHASEFMAEGDFERATELVRNLLTDTDREWDTLEFTLVTATGERIPVEANLVALTDDTGIYRGNVGVVRDITERKRREQKLTALHDIADDLTTSESVEAVCERTVEASQTILEYDQCVIDIEDDGLLRPIAQSKSIPTSGLTTMSVDEGIAGKSYRTGKSFVINDISDHDDANPQGSYQSAISVPIGEHGVFQAVADSIDAFDEADRELTELLISHTESALDRIERERELQRQNERLDEFASVVSHDLRNPLNVAEGRLKLAQEEYDSEHLTDAANAVDRSLTLIDDLLTLAREGERVTEVEAIDLADLSEECWRTVETRAATFVVETNRTIQADRGRVTQLLENLMRNAIEHGGDGVTVTIGDFDDGFYVTDDGPGIPEEARDRVFEAGYSTTDGGTGFGLNIVREIADAHGWDIRIADSEAGGARFEIAGVEFGN